MSTEQIVGSATLPELPDLATHKRKSFQYTALGAQLKNVPFRVFRTYL